MSQRKFEGKIAVVTASSTGIGYAIVERLAKEGATVIVSSRNQKHVDHAVSEIQKQGGKADGVVCHASNKDDRAKLLNYVKDKYGGIDILIPNAAVSTFFGPFLDTNEKQMDKMYDVNFKAVFFLIQEALPLMEGRKGANIIVMSSYAAYEPANEIGFYSITKSMLTVLTKMTSRQLINDNIRVNAICPGLIKTNFAKALYEGREEQVIRDLKVNRLGIPSDISNTVAFLASDEASYINGESIQVIGKASPRL